MLSQAVTVAESNAQHEARVASDVREHTVLTRQLYYSPATGVETPETINKILMALWPAYLERKITKKIGEKISKRIRDSAPPNMDVTVESLTLGSAAPYLSNFQAFSDSEGNLTHWDMSVKFVSSQLAVAIAALVNTAGMNVNTKVTVRSVSISGHLRFYPFLEERLVLYGFKEKPATKLQVRVKGPGGVEAELGGFSFLEKAFDSVMDKKFTLPHRKAIGLEINDLFADVVGAQVLVRVVGVSGLPAAQANNAEAVEMEVKLQAITRQLGGTVDGSGCVAFDQKLSLQLDGQDGQLFFKVIQNRKPIGTASMLLDHMADGTTAWWGQLQNGVPFAARQRAKGAPWKVTIPLEEQPEVKVSLEVRVREWQYHKAEEKVQKAKVQGGNAMVVQVVEARQLVAVHKDHSDPYVKLRYGETEVSTQHIDKTLSPFWNETFILDENLFSSKLVIEVWDHNDTSADRPMGRASLRTGALTEDLTDSWLQLNGVSTGELRVRALRLPGSSEDPSVVFAGTQLKGMDPTLEVTLSRGIDLISCDRLGSSDPFVVLTYGEVRHKTHVKRNTLNPRWAEVKVLRYREGTELRLEVYDWDRVGSPDYMGYAEVSADTLAGSALVEQPSVMTLTLQDVKSGQLEISVKRTATRVSRSRQRGNMFDSPPGSPQPSSSPSDGGPTSRRRGLSGHLRNPTDAQLNSPLSPLMAMKAAHSAPPGGAVPDPAPSSSSSSSPLKSFATSMYNSSRRAVTATSDMLAPLVSFKTASPLPPLALDSNGAEKTVAELQGEVEAKDEEMAELKAKHERVLARMKRDQSALLEKVRELEEALEDL